MLCCACSQGSAVTVPFRLGIELRAMRKLEAQLTQQLGRPPTQAEVVAEVRSSACSCGLLCSQHMCLVLANFVCWLPCRSFERVCFDVH